jgi:VIT1/CCC1 family predicted Fe2+/Mn2+ transporter
MSMAAGEWVSVSSQRDGELADLDIERGELSTDPEGELAELTGIYVRRGVPVDLARQVAKSLSTNNVLDAHAHDELGLDPGRLARPAQAATVSAASFAIGAFVPIATAAVVPTGLLTLGLAVTALVALGVLGAIGAEVGGGRRWRGTLRVMIGGGLAMLVTGLVGRAVHATGL